MQQDRNSSQGNTMKNYNPADRNFQRADNDIRAQMGSDDYQEEDEDMEDGEDMEDTEETDPVLTEQDLEENDLGIEEADDIEWEETDEDDDDEFDDEDEEF